MEPYTNNHSTLEPEVARFYIARSHLKVKTQNEKPLHVIFIKMEWADILYYVSHCLCLKDFNARLQVLRPRCHHLPKGMHNLKDFCEKMSPW